jgi:hypothetical protein
MERTLTWRELNRAMLARQLLLERSSLTVPEVLERMGGLQAQYAPSMYIGLWSRVAGFDRESLTRLLEERAVVQATLLRSTIHLVSRADYWPFEVGARAARRAAYDRAVRDRPSEEAMAASVLHLRALMAERPVRRSEIDTLFGPRTTHAITTYMSLVRVPPSGTWARRRADLFGSAEEWLGPPDATEDDAQDLLLRRYLGAFGPANVREFADWAGLPPPVATKIVARHDLATFRDERGRVLVDLPGAPLPPADTPAPVRFLPTWEATLLVHARRTLILPEEHRPKIFHVRMPQSIGTFLVDGQVAGTWTAKSGAVVWESFAPLSAGDRRAVDAEAERLTEFHR